jgi:hypothetical protein
MRAAELFGKGIRTRGKECASTHRCLVALFLTDCSTKRYPAQEYSPAQSGQGALYAISVSGLLRQGVGRKGTLGKSGQHAGSVKQT